MLSIIINDEDSAAMADNSIGEILAILDKVKEDIQEGRRSAPLRDSNGNRVGRFHFYPGELT